MTTSFTRYGDRPNEITYRRTSQGRSWIGVMAAVYDVTAGYSHPAISQSHNITMLVGRPIGTVACCDGQVSRRIQAPGELDILPAGYTGTWEDEASSTFLTIRLSPCIVSRAAQGLGRDDSGITVFPKLGLRDPRIEHIAWALKAELESPDPVGPLYAESLGLALAAHLLSKHAPEIIHRHRNDLSKRRLKSIIDYINENLSDELTLFNIANIAQISESRLKVVFKSAMGMPIHQYVMRQRVDYASRLIRSRQYPLSQVAATAGFADQSHMSRCLRRVLGVTPRSLVADQH